MMKDTARKPDISYELMGSIFLSISLLACVFYAFGKVNSDVYFILANGRYITETGDLFPSTLFYTMHKGFATVIQQPLFSVISWVCFRAFGFLGVFGFASFCVILVSFLLLFIFKDVKSPFIRYLLASLYLLNFCTVFCGRPSQLTLIILILEYMILALAPTGRKKTVVRALFLLLLSLVSLLTHAAFYPFYIFILLFFCAKSLLQYKVIDAGALSAGIISVITTFLTPYGAKLPLYLFISYPAAVKGGNIIELRSAQLLSVHTLFCVALLIFTYKTFKKDLIYEAMLALIGVVLLSFHLRNFWLLGVFSMPYVRESVSFVEPFGHPPKTRRKIPVISYVPYLLPLILILFKVWSCEGYEPQDSSITPVLACSYLEGRSDKVFTEFNNGAFFEFMGIDSYIDARPELYQSAINGKENVYDEYISLLSDADFEYNSFIEQYDFDYLIATRGTPLYFYLRLSDGYKSVVKGNGYELFEVER